jgi:tetratricopeptide (TPR) repeat protein
MPPRRNAPPSAESSAASVPTPALWPAWSTRTNCALIFLAALLAYWPALGGGTIWDDDGHITRADLTSLTGLMRIWFEPGATQQYYPLLHSAFWLEHHLWGDAALGYHLLNVLLHATAACLFATLLRRLAVPGAWFAAAIFALHPVCVESVAWISEQKNTLSTVLYLCAALAYLRFDATRRPVHYAAATAIFLAALFTKTVTATLPAALLVLFWWQRGPSTPPGSAGRLDPRRDLAPLAPWFVLGAASGLFTAHFERVLIGAQGSDFALSWLERGLLAGRVVWFYLGKLLWPADLIFIYPRWTIDSGAAWQWLFPLATLTLLGVAAWWARRSRGPLAALLIFGGSLFPALGFVNVFPFIFSFVADHFQYLACLGVIALVPVTLHRALARAPRGVAVATPAVLVIVLGALTFRQAGMYRNVITLYETTLARNPACWMAHNNLGNVLALAGRADEAVAHFEAALKLRPDYPEAESNLGDQLNQLNRSAEAIPHLERALRRQPDYAGAHNNLGIAFMATQRAAAGMAEFATALRLRPAYPEAHFNLGLALAKSGRTDEAIAHFTEAVRLRPDYANAELNWGVALMLANRFAEAVPHFERAVASAPDAPEIHNTYGRALAANGRLDAAVAQLETALSLNPGLADAHLNLALALRQLGRTQEAAQHYTEALRLNPALGSAPP